MSHWLSAFSVATHPQEPSADSLEGEGTIVSLQPPDTSSQYMSGFLQLQFFFKWPKTLYSLLPVPEYTSPVPTNSSPPSSRAPHTLHGTCLRLYILWDTFPDDPNKKSIPTFLDLIILQLLAYSFHSVYRTLHSWLSVCCARSLQSWRGKGAHLFHPPLCIPGYSRKIVRDTHTCVLLWDGSKPCSFTVCQFFSSIK